MNQALQSMYATAAKATAIAMSNADEKPTCSRGCYHCCKEPVQADNEEARNILDGLTQEQRDELAPKLRAWLEKFLASGLQARRQPDVKDYRPLNLWCPLLAKDGTCSVYDRRPLACRLHFACSPVSKCQFDDQRHEAKHAIFPHLFEHILADYVSHMEQGQKIITDHLCVVLALELFKEDHPTEGRCEMWKDGETIYIKRSEQE